MKKLLAVCAALFLAAWVTHLTIGTTTLRGFFGDGAMQFLINVSHSYVFNEDSRWVHLFSVGFPRDTALLLNAVGLQIALWLHVTDMGLLKRIFVFWQFASPGFLYLGLFAALWRAGKTNWAIFPLMSWMVSIPVDWNAINDTRWAMPIFWMHVFLVLLAPKKISLRPALAATVLGVAMFGGLYESVIFQAALLLAVGALLWVREGNRASIWYAAAAIPGAIRAILSFIDIAPLAANNFTGFQMTGSFLEPYYLLIILTVLCVLVLGHRREVPSYFSAQFAVLFAVVLALGLAAWIKNPPPIWAQADRMRFDYVALTLGFMAWASAVRLFGGAHLDKAGPGRAVPAAILVLLTGSVLWSVQARQTDTWRACQSAYHMYKGTAPVLIDAQFAPLFTTDKHVRAINPYMFNDCLWDWTVPWAELLVAPKGQVRQWPVYTFWQDFRFIEKQGNIYLHTNNWTMTSPSVLDTSEDLPLTTMLYDLSPLYKMMGQGPLLQRAGCVLPNDSGNYWAPTLERFDDTSRRSMFVCTRAEERAAMSAPQGIK